jgi:dTDP-4-dehydrorhamnose reductase
MKILITGANGLLGSSLCPHLLSCGHTILRQSRTANDAQVVTHLTDYQSLANAFTECHPDVIINLAALANVDACEQDPHSAYRANTLIVENLARWIRDNSPKAHLVQISTDHVYEGSGSHTEDTVNLTNYYAFSKYAGELAAKRADATILRTNFFGISLCPGRKTLSDWLVESLKANAIISIFEDVFFSPLELTSLCRYIELAARKKKPGVFNLGSRDGLSKADFAEKLAKATGLSAANANRQSIVTMDLKAYRPRNMRMNVQAFQEAFSLELPDINQEIESAGRLYCSAK